MSSSAGNKVRTLRSILRRAAFAVPGLRTVGGSGCPQLPDAAEREGLQYSEDSPDLWIIWARDETWQAASFPAGTAKCMVVIAAHVEGHPLPVSGGTRPAKETLTLREWVARWPMGPVLRPLLASDAVGARTSSVAVPGNFEHHFLADGIPPRHVHPGGWKEALVTFLGTGLFPIMPATLACLVMLPPALLLRHFLGGEGFLLLSALVLILATAASCVLESWAARRFQAEDPREFVLDEVAGMAVTWAFLPPSAPWWLLLVGFLAFRIFDIFKWGVSWIEKLPVHGKIVWDDVLAGVYAGVVTLIVARWVA